MKLTKKGFRRLIISGILIIAIFVLQAFQLQSNLFLLLPQKGELLLKDGNGWKKLNPDDKGFTAKTEFQSDGFSVHQLTFRRNHTSFFQRQVSKLMPGKIKIMEITPDNEFMIVADSKSGFQSMNSNQALKSSSANFVLNANFYGTQNQILGELILNGKKHHQETRDSGFFRVINNAPYVGPRSFVNSVPGTIQFSCQAFPSVINNGQVFSYIKTESGPSKPLWKKKTYRNLIGQKKNGNMVFILSNQRGFLSVREISYLAKIYGVETASLFDGGRALQYRLDHPDYKMSFSAFNNKIYLGKKVDDYFKRKYNGNFVQKSPVYIGVKFNPS